MERSLNMMRSYIPMLAIILLTAFILSSCKKNDYHVSGDYPVAGLMAFNLSPDKEAAGFSISGNTLGSVMGYTDYTGLYLPIYLGNREVRTFDYFTGSTIAIANEDFKDSMYYSTFLVGANGNYRNIIVNDELNSVSPVSGKAWVRYINAIPDSSTAPVVSVGGDAATSASYGTVSAFKQVSAGAVNTSVSNGSTINSSRSINMEENKLYTLLLVGLPNATDSTKKVQIKYIVNGVATQ